ncbi:MAG: hypothetical protein A2V77_13440 [Anaeromyxobacter sp. RBG_16_69_14]|nr:MAG: hypothetical protein A2V77_13440 [Anaeromyxobacter sp. RBG_16_69_14]
MRPRLRATRPNSANSAAVLTKATRRAATQLGISDAVLADVLGVSASSVSRLGAGRMIEPESAEGERALLFLRVFRGLDGLLGDGESCKKWFNSEHLHLRGVPAELIRSVEGLVHVTRYLDAMRGKI